ncbi:MAG: TIGR04219 family outer membrane beta-barrel protein [Rheinheimera sp.]
MKVVVFILAAGLLSYQPQVQADLLGVTFSGDFAQLEVSGRAGDNLASQSLQFSDDRWQSWSIAFEHPLPLVPNVLLRRQNGNWTGQTQLRGDLQLDGQIFPSQSTITNALDLQTTDLSFYYEVLDNSLLALDLGVSAMRFETMMSATQVRNTQRTASGYLPLLYGNFVLQLWGTDTTLFWQGFYADYQDQQWSQTKVGLGYEMLNLTAVSIALKVGWQHQSVQFVDVDDLDADMLMKGAFVALEIDF